MIVARMGMGATFGVNAQGQQYTGFTADQLRAMGYEGQVPVYGVADSDPTLVTGAADYQRNMQCIQAEQNQKLALDLSEYIRQTIGANGGASDTWLWSQWNSLQQTIQQNNAQKLSTCGTLVLGNQGPIANLAAIYLSVPDNQQMAVDGSGYTMQQKLDIAKQAVDYQVYGHSNNAPQTPTTIQYIDPDTYVIKTQVIGANCGLTPQQIAGGFLTPQQAQLCSMGQSAIAAAAANSSSGPIPNVAVTVPATASGTPSHVSNPSLSNPSAGASVFSTSTTNTTPAVALPTTADTSSDFMTQIQQPVLGVPLWAWAAGGIAAVALL